MQMTPVSILMMLDSRHPAINACLISKISAASYIITVFQQ